MTAAQELLGLLVNARPGHRHEPKAKSKGSNFEHFDNGPKPAPFAEAMPNWVAVELPALGGRADIVSVFVEKRIAIGEMSTREQSVLTRVDCERCGQPRNQQLINRTFAWGEHWSVLPCTSCPLDLGVRT